MLSVFVELEALFINHHNFGQIFLEIILEPFFTISMTFFTHGGFRNGIRCREDDR